MTSVETKDKDQTSEIISVLKKLLQEASEKGPEETDNFFKATAFALGSFMPLAVEEKDFGLATSCLIDSLVAGIEAGVQMVGNKSGMTVVRFSRN